MVIKLLNEIIRDFNVEKALFIFHVIILKSIMCLIYNLAIRIGKNNFLYIKLEKIVPHPGIEPGPPE